MRITLLNEGGNAIFKASQRYRRSNDVFFAIKNTGGFTVSVEGALVDCDLRIGAGRNPYRLFFFKDPDPSKEIPYDRWPLVKDMKVDSADDAVKQAEKFLGLR